MEADLAFEPWELKVLEEQRRIYLKWISDIEAGTDEYLAKQWEYGRLIDDRAESLARYKENVAEIERLFEIYEVPHA